MSTHITGKKKELLSSNEEWKKQGEEYSTLQHDVGTDCAGMGINGTIMITLMLSVTYH